MEVEPAGTVAVAPLIATHPLLDCEPSASVKETPAAAPVVAFVTEVNTMLTSPFDFWMVN
jgi:hypothetical protein